MTNFVIAIHTWQFLSDDVSLYGGKKCLCRLRIQWFCSSIFWKVLNRCLCNSTLVFTFFFGKNYVLLPVIPFLIIYLSFVAQTVSLCCPEPHFIKTGNATLIFRNGIISELCGHFNFPYLPNHVAYMA